MKTLLSADNAAACAIMIRDFTDNTIDIVRDLSVAVCRLDSPRKYERRPPFVVAPTVEVDFDGRRNVITSLDSRQSSSVMIVKSKSKRSLAKRISPNKRGRRRDAVRDNF